LNSSYLFFAYLPPGQNLRLLVVAVRVVGAAPLRPGGVVGLEELPNLVAAHCVVIDVDLVDGAVEGILCCVRIGSYYDIICKIVG